MLKTIHKKYIHVYTCTFIKMLSSSPFTKFLNWVTALGLQLGGATLENFDGGLIPENLHFCAKNGPSANEDGSSATLDIRERKYQYTCIIISPFFSPSLLPPPFLPLSFPRYSSPSAPPPPPPLSTNPRLTGSTGGCPSCHSPDRRR